MANLGILAASAVGLATVSVGGLYIYKSQKSESEWERLLKGILSQFSTTLGEEWKNKRWGKCVSDMFGEVDLYNELIKSIGKSSLPEDSNYFGNPNSNRGEIKGCLFVEWNKNSKKEDPKKWIGNINWFWIFKNGDKGLVSVLNGGVNDLLGGKFNLKGASFFLEKEDDSKWRIKHSQLAPTGKEINEGNFDSAFPRENDSIKAGDSGSYWGFVEGKEDLKSACGLLECVSELSEESKSFNGKWSWGDAGSHKIHEWSKDMGWWDYLYGSGTFKWKENLSKFQGTWTAENNAAG